MTTQGTTLIEVLMSLLILSLLLLGMDAMQLTLLRKIKTAYHLTVATQQLKVIAGRLSVFKDRIQGEPLLLWNQQNQTVLPEGRGTITGSFPHYIATIHWGRSQIGICDKPQLGLSGCLRLVINL